MELETAVADKPTTDEQTPRPSEPRPVHIAIAKSGAITVDGKPMTEEELRAFMTGGYYGEGGADN
jgi:biopolymer transport protein ExbD